MFVPSCRYNTEAARVLRFRDRIPCIRRVGLGFPASLINEDGRCLTSELDQGRPRFGPFWERPHWAPLVSRSEVSCAFLPSSPLFHYLRAVRPIPPKLPRNRTLKPLQSFLPERKLPALSK